MLFKVYFSLITIFEYAFCDILSIKCYFCKPNIEDNEIFFYSFLVIIATG